MRVNVDGGENLRVQEAGCPEGTTFVMKDLFYNIPVRRAFLKKPSYEGGLVGDAVARLMLGNPGVSMRFISNGSTVYHTFGDGNLRHAVFAVYGKATAEKMIELDAAEGGTRVRGMIGVGELAKATRAHQMFFINGRSVRCALLSRVLERVCKSRVTIGMYPMCALSLTLPPNSIDVNVHPNKLEVRFRDEESTQIVVEKLLNSAFEGEKVLEFRRDAAPQRSIQQVTTVREITPEELKRPQEMPELKPETAVGPREPEKKSVPEAAPTQQPKMPPLPNAVRESGFMKALSQERRRFDQAPTGSTGSTQGQLREAVLAAIDRPDRSVRPEPPALKPVQDEQLRMPELVQKKEEGTDYRIIGVAFKTYILIEVEDTLLLIDQHAAHERLRYEMYMKQLEEGAASQQLLTPLVIRLSDREMALIRDNLDALSEAGYAVEPFGEHDIQVRAVPYILGKAEIRPLFLDVINSLTRLKSATLDARRAEIMQMACKSAVKGGDALSDSEIRALIREMLETGAPPTCPHGRPVVKALSRRDLEKMFKRIQ